MDCPKCQSENHDQIDDTDFDQCRDCGETFFNDHSSVSEESSEIEIIIEDEIEKLKEENRRLRCMCKKYLIWLHIDDVDNAVEKDLNDPTMWS